MSVFSFQHLHKIVASEAAAIRRILTLQPTGGADDKVFPPSYAGADGPVYAMETRRLEGKDVVAVALDSPQSQANRLELGLLRGYRAGKLSFPLMAIDFSQVEGASEIGELTLLELPHRIADAAARDSIYQGKPFREAFDWHKATTTNATPLFATCPQALVFGVWDSMGQAGGLGMKFPRALVSEIIGYGVQKGVRSGGKLDSITTGATGDLVLYQTEDRRLTVDATEATMVEKKGKKEPKTVRASELGYGHVTPSLANEDGVPYRGGVTFDSAKQTTVLSLNALRRLRFPIDGVYSHERDLAAQTTLAALALAAVAFQGTDYFLRSRCDLVPVERRNFEIVGIGETSEFEISTEIAAQLLQEAAAEAVRTGLPWNTELIRLEPSKSLAKLAVNSRQLKGQSEKSKD
jgi:CRISPR-associated protein Csb1